ASFRRQEVVAVGIQAIRVDAVTHPKKPPVFVVEEPKIHPSSERSSSLHEHAQAGAERFGSGGFALELDLLWKTYRRQRRTPARLGNRRDRELLAKGELRNEEISFATRFAQLMTEPIEPRAKLAEER